jgi:hypothetical protein
MVESLNRSAGKLISAAWAVVSASTIQRFNNSTKNSAANE